VGNTCSSIHILCCEVARHGTSNFDKKFRTTLTKHRLHHPRSFMHRLHLSRNCGGRRLLSVEVCVGSGRDNCGSTSRHKIRHCTKQFVHKTEIIHHCNCVPKNITTVLGPKERAEQWRAKERHGRFANALNRESTDSVRSTEWIRTAGSFGETEDFIAAIQDQVITTRS
jgi:hypothetical protein